MVIDCKAISQAKRDAIKRKAAELDITPTLAVILAVDDPASRVYVRNKRRACEEVGFGFEMYSDINAVGELVTRQDVHGVLVQLPLPSDIDTNKVIAQIPPEKDVDALTATNLGRLVLGAYDFAPCTPFSHRRPRRHHKPCGYPDFCRWKGWICNGEHGEAGCNRH